MIRVLIADDHGIVRSGLRMLIDRQLDMEVVAEADDGVAALESTQSHRPDVAVLDVSMPRMTGLQAAREIRAHVPGTRVLLLSMHDDERYFLEGLEAGAAELRVRDDGDGFNPSAVTRSSSDVPGGGLGLVGMAERARLVGGELDVRSAPGGGTTITLRVPS